MMKSKEKKKKYNKPKLTVHGTVQEITKAKNPGPDDVQGTAVPS